VYKSPEMLLMNAGGSSSNNSYHPGLSSGLIASAMRPGGNMAQGSASPSAMRRGATANSSRTIGAGLASDIWSFGCLCYELLSGKPLFGQADYASITHRVAFGGGPHLLLTPAECDALGGRDGPGALFVSLVEWVLARNPETRPRLPHILARLKSLREEQLQLAAQQQA
jgi:serine/threonine protein kinase